MAAVRERSSRPGIAFSARVVEVALRFGIPLREGGRPAPVLAGLDVGFPSGSATLICGPSGAGKSLLLEEIGRALPTSRRMDAVQFPLDVPVLDAVAPARPVAEAIALLVACGLSEPRLWLRPLGRLSVGEQFRARLARAVWLHRRDGGGSPLLCDEFASNLHGRLARAVAFNLRKLVRREGLVLVVASSRDDLEADLAPDRVVRLPLGLPGPAQPACWESYGDNSNSASGRVGAVDGRVRLPSFARELRIEPGAIRDYAAFSRMHYRQREQIGFVDKVFVLRERPGGDVLGVVVYGHAALELAVRNRVTGKRFAGQGRRLNQELRVLRRLVVHPDVRGCGLGHLLVAATLPLVGTPFVECLAAMGAVHPVFEKAGMRRMGVCEPPADRRAALEKLRAAGADPLAADFCSQVRQRPLVRQMVASAVRSWYRATTAGGEDRAARQSPAVLAHTFRQLAGSAPVYFLWCRDAEGWELIERAACGPLDEEARALPA